MEPFKTLLIKKILTLFILEFLKFVAHQEQCRKKWLTVEEENHDMKKFMAKYKVLK